VEAEPEWSDATLIIDLLLEAQVGAHRLRDYFEATTVKKRFPNGLLRSEPAHSSCAR
jgi:hypothetical protein